MKIIATSPSWHLIKLQGKLELTGNGGGGWGTKSTYSQDFFLYFSKFQCASYQPISVADLG
jgi:hypothetical protein